MAKFPHARTEELPSLSNVDLARIAGQVAAQQVLDALEVPLSYWRNKHFAQFERAIGGCVDMPARLGAWDEGFNQAVLSRLEGRGGGND